MVTWEEGQAQAELAAQRVKERADKIMSKMGFDHADNGPFVTKLRAEIERQVRDHGLVSRSGGTWARNDLSAEERARVLLEWEWEIAKGHYCEVKNIDDRAHVGDRLRSLWLTVRVFWGRRILRRRNPYSRPCG